MLNERSQVQKRKNFMVIETIPGVASGKGEGDESKRLAEMFWGEMMEMF